MSKIETTETGEGQFLPSAAESTTQPLNTPTTDAVTEPSGTSQSFDQRQSLDSATDAVSLADPAPETDQQFHYRSSLPRRALAVLRGHLVLIIACGGSLGVGCGLGKYFQPASPVQVSEIDRPVHNAEPQIFLASTLRRHEPIAPLAPFEQLDASVVDLGRRLFHEPGLSDSGTVSCASCHPLNAGGTLHAQPPSTGNGGTASYDAPTVLNAALNCAQSWEGGTNTLEKYVDTSISAPHELGSNWNRVTKFLSSDPYYSETFKRVMHGEPTPESIGSALVTFLRSLITVNSKFDQWLQGSEAALDSDEFGGYFLFKKFGCISCHQGAGVGGTMFQPLGVAKPYFDQNATPADLGRFNVTGQERDKHVFRVPSLRNVQLTAPYLHDGSIPTLEEMVEVMIETQCGQEYSAEDVRRLTAFLNSLTGELPPAAAGKVRAPHQERSREPHM